MRSRIVSGFLAGGAEGQGGVDRDAGGVVWVVAELALLRHRPARMPPGLSMRPWRSARGRGSGGKHPCRTFIQTRRTPPGFTRASRREGLVRANLQIVLVSPGSLTSPPQTRTGFE